MDSKKQQSLIEQLTMICEELGWVVGLPSTEDDNEKVPGLVVGEESFVIQVVSSYSDDYEVYSKDMNNEEMHELEGESYEERKAKKTYH